MLSEMPVDIGIPILTEIIRGPESFFLKPDLFCVAPEPFFLHRHLFVCTRAFCCVAHEPLFLHTACFFF